MPYYPERKPDKPEKRREPQKTAVYRLMRRILLCLFAGMIIYGTVRLTGYGAELSASKGTSRELQQICDETEPLPDEPAPAAEKTIPPADNDLPETAAERPAEKKEDSTLPPVPYPDNPGMKVSDRFIRLRKKSGYIIGWISMDGIEEAVALKDNTFFLNHDAEGKKNSNGAIFLDAGTDLLTRPYTVYLYGHNMKSGNMFGRLKKYLDSAYYFKHRIITFDSLYEDGRYAVFAAAEFSTVSGETDYYDLWSLDTKDRKNREQAIRRLTAINLYDTLLDVRADEQILLLVTCIDDDTDRLVIAARRLREGESENNLNIRKE